MNGHLILLASYPKSGNTWLRLVLANLLAGGPVPLDAGVGRRADPIDIFDRYSPWPAGEIGAPQAAALLPDLYRQLAAEANAPFFLKTHLTPTVRETGEWLYPPEVVRVALVLVRHPFDVAVSLAAHLGLPVAGAIDRMIHGLTGGSLAVRWGTWPAHWRSWTDPRLPYRTRVVRYEDLLQDPETGFGTLAAEAGVSFDRYALRGAIDATRFDRLQREEERCGFPERFPDQKRFFRAGRSGTWRGQLPAEECRRLLAACGPAMEELGYGAEGEVFAGKSTSALRDAEGCHAHSAGA